MPSSSPQKAPLPGFETDSNSMDHPLVGFLFLTYHAIEALAIRMSYCIIVV